MPKPSRRVSSLAVAVLAAYWLIIFIGTHWPQLKLPKVTHGDKLAHFGAYAGLAFLLSAVVLLRYRTWNAVYVRVLLIAAAYGVVDELSQTFVPGRTADLYDWLADVLGAVLGIIAFRLTFPLLPHARFRWLDAKYPFLAEGQRGRAVQSARD